MKHTKLFFLLIPFLSLLVLILGRNSESAIMAGLLYMFSLFILGILSLILIVSQKTRQEGLLMLLGLGILLVIGFAVCSGF